MKPMQELSSRTQSFISYKDVAPIFMWGRGPYPTAIVCFFEFWIVSLLTRAFHCSCICHLSHVPLWCVVTFSLHMLFSCFCCSCILQFITFHAFTVLMHLSPIMLLTCSSLFTPLTCLSPSMHFTAGCITQCSHVLGCGSVNVHAFFDFHALHLFTL